MKNSGIHGWHQSCSTAASVLPCCQCCLEFPALLLCPLLDQPPNLSWSVSSYFEKKARPVLRCDRLFFHVILSVRKQSLTFLCSHWSSFWPRCYETLSQALIRNLASLHASGNGDITIQALALERTRRWRWEERRDCLAAILTECA